MRCGNCHQHHPNVQDVKDCYAGRGVEPSGALPKQPTKGSRATDKQVDFIVKLAQERDIAVDADFMEVTKALTRKEASSTIDSLLAQKPEGAHEACEHAQEPDVTTVPLVRDGTYTVVFTHDEVRHYSDGDSIAADVEERRTLRLRDATSWAKDLPAGSQVAEFLSGPDNETDFTGFAFVVNGKPRVWRRFRESGSTLTRALPNESRIVQALEHLLGMDDPSEAGYRYALESSRCYRCNHKLTVPASIHRGLGPVCAGMAA